MAAERLYLAVLRIFSVWGTDGGGSDVLKRRYIELNNKLVISGAKRFLPSEILVLLPRCLQNSGCSRSVTDDIKNCACCGNCSIGRISKGIGKAGVDGVVAAGGTAAREAMKMKNPKLVFSVACERELAGGISDSAGIDVIGFINSRPSGPCKDTAVDAEALLLAIDGFIETRGRGDSGKDRNT